MEDSSPSETKSFILDRGLTAHDLGFRDDFEELPVWMVVNAATQAKIVAITPVSRTDLSKKHEPPLP